MENQTFTADLITNIYFNQTFHVDLSTSFMGNTMTTPATEKETSHPGPATLLLALAIPLLIMATVGNSLAFAVMRRRSMRNTSPGVYFAAIACADTVTVYWGAVPFLIFYFTSIDLWSYHPWSCRVVIFILFTSADSAVWLLVAVTVDRFIAVKFPLVRKQMCTPKRAFIVACVLPSIAIIKNLHLFFTRGRQVIVDAALPEEEWAVSNCGFPTPEIEFFETYIRSWIAFSLYAVVPIVSVFILNVLIIRTLYTSRKVTTVTAAGEAKPSAREERARRSNYQLTERFHHISDTHHPKYHSIGDQTIPQPYEEWSC